MIALAWSARSKLILAAALALGLNWLISLYWWWTGAAHGHVWGLAINDAVLAAFFWRLSRRKWFPVPLFFIEAVLLCYYGYVAIFGVKTWFWISAFINRLFDLELIYVAACALYRIRALRRARERA